MTLTSVETAGLRSARLSALWLVFALALSACTIGFPSEDALDAVHPTKDAMDTGESDETIDVAMPPSEDPATPEPEPEPESPDVEHEDVEDTGDGADDEPQPPVSPPGTINDLEDLIGNENDDGVRHQGNGSRVERFVTALLAQDDDDAGLDISEADARCAGEMLDERLSETSFELLVSNLETINEIEDGNQFTDAELLVISESLADCIDLRTLVDEVVDGGVALGSLVSCLASEVGVDSVEALLLFEILGENGSRVTTPIFLTGLELCPSEARAAIDEAILDQFLLADAPVIEACLAEIGSAELRPFFETREFSELISMLREQCLF